MKKKRWATGERGGGEKRRGGILTSGISRGVATKLRGKGRLHSRARVVDEQPGPLSYVIS